MKLVIGWNQRHLGWRVRKWNLACVYPVTDSPPGYAQYVCRFCQAMPFCPKHHDNPRMYSIFKDSFIMRTGESVAESDGRVGSGGGCSCGPVRAGLISEWVTDARRPARPIPRQFRVTCLEAVLIALKNRTLPMTSDDSTVGRIGADKRVWIVSGIVGIDSGAALTVLPAASWKPLKLMARHMTPLWLDDGQVVTRCGSGRQVV